MFNCQHTEIINYISNQGLKMRRKLNRQMKLFTSPSSNPIAKELEQVSQILDANSHLLDLVYQDLTKAKRYDTGREGITAEQVLRCVVLKQYRQLSYEELSLHLVDSSAFRTFSRLEMAQYSCKSILPGETSRYLRKTLGRRFIGRFLAMPIVKRSRRAGRFGLTQPPLSPTLIT